MFLHATCSERIFCLKYLLRWKLGSKTQVPSTPQRARCRLSWISGFSCVLTLVFFFIFYFCEESHPFYISNFSVGNNISYWMYRSSLYPYTKLHSATSSFHVPINVLIYIYIYIYIYDIKVPSLRHVSAWQCHLQGAHTKLKTTYSKIDYVYEIHNLQWVLKLIRVFVWTKLC